MIEPILTALAFLCLFAAALPAVLAALGLDQVRIATLTGSANYAAAFRAARPRPEPGAIKPCKAAD